MKRLGIYAVIGIFLMGMAISSPQHAFAETDPTTSSPPTTNPSPKITQVDVDRIVSKGVAALSAIPNIDKEDEGQKLYVAKLSTIAKSTFASKGGDLALTPAGLEVAIFRAYLSVLGDFRLNADNQHSLYLTADMNAVNVLINAAEIATRVETGQITQEQAKNSNAEAAAAAAKISSAINPNNCSLGSGNLLGCIDQLITWFIKVTLLQIAGFLVWLSANMLNLSIQVGILNFAQWAQPSLYPIWLIIRQIVSLFVVFAGLYLGFMYIIGRDDKFKKYIPWVVIFAIFVNFSYPLTRVLIDVSNIISLNIYASAVGTDALTTDLGTSALPFSGKSTPGSLIMDKLGLQGLVTSATAVDNKGTMFGNINSTPGALAAVAFVLYAAFIFFMATWIMISRTAILIFLTIASPLLFVDSVIPLLGERASKLRTMYFEQLAVAPVFMIMLALTLKFLEVFQTNGPLSAAAKGGVLASAVSGGTASISTFFNIIMMLIMLHITLKVTTSVAGDAGNWMGGMMGKVGGFGLGVASGGTGILARASLGRAAAAARDSSWVTNNQHSALGRRAYSMANSLASSTYDPRNSKVISKGMANAGMGMGKGGTESYDSELKTKTDTSIARYGRIQTTNFDGTKNEEGSLAKQRFFTGAGGALTNKQEVRDALLERDREEAKKMNRQIDKNTSRTSSQSAQLLEELDKKKKEAGLGETRATNPGSGTSPAEKSARERAEELERDPRTAAERAQAEAIRAQGELDKKIRTGLASNPGTNSISDAQASVEGLTQGEPTLAESQAKINNESSGVDIMQTPLAKQLAERRAKKQKEAFAQGRQAVTPTTNEPKNPTAEELAQKIAQEAIQKASRKDGDDTSAVTLGTPPQDKPSPDNLQEGESVA